MGLDGQIVGDCIGFVPEGGGVREALEGKPESTDSVAQSLPSDDLSWLSTISPRARGMAQDHHQTRARVPALGFLLNQPREGACVGECPYPTITIVVVAAADRSVPVNACVHPHGQRLRTRRHLEPLPSTMSILASFGQIRRGKKKKGKTQWRIVHNHYSKRDKGRILG